MSLLLVHSPKGGVGCSTLAANLAAWLARGGRRVLVVDFSPYETLALHLRREIELAQEFRWNDANEPVRDRADTAGEPRIRLMARSTGLAIDHMFREIDHALAQDERLRPLVIVDVPACDQMVLDRLAPRALISLCVLAADAGSALMLPGLLAAVPPVGAPRQHYVLNRLDERRSVGREFQRLLRVAVGDDLVAVIRSDEAANEALASLSSVFDQAPASAIAIDLAAIGDRIAASLEMQRTAHRDEVV